MLADDLWTRFRRATPARIALGRTGNALPNGAMLKFQLAHAQARDAVHGAVDFDALAVELAPLETIQVSSAAEDRRTYLRRPDLGRSLATDDADKLPRGEWDIVFVIGDGLSASAVDSHAAPMIRAAMERLPGKRIAPIVLASQARVALGDAIGEALGARLCVMLIGERPGLSVPNSLGIYLTWEPRIGRKDAERNCLSNIHADGLSYATAADKLAWLVGEATRRQLTGVMLKEDAPATATLDVAAPVEARALHG